MGFKIKCKLQTASDLYKAKHGVAALVFLVYECEYTSPKPVDNPDDTQQADGHRIETTTKSHVDREQPHARPNAPSEAVQSGVFRFIRASP